MKIKCFSLLTFLALVTLSQGCLAQQYRPALTSIPALPVTAQTDYLTLRKNYKTVLQKRTPAPQDWDNEKPPRGTAAVFYNSGNLKLKGWLTLPANVPAGKVPAVVFFHGGFAFGSDDLEACQPFLENGFAVFTPMLRGENGNPGSFELFYGEVEDGRAAVQWLAKQPRIDSTRIYTFGHSIGGGISALLSLWDDVPIKMSGSSGGLYSNNTFEDWAEIIPFDANNQKERKLRLLIGNLASMKIPHIAYVGIQDSPETESVAITRAEAKISKAPLTIKIVEGDHFESLKPAIASFITVIKTDK